MVRLVVLVVRLVIKAGRIAIRFVAAIGHDRAVESVAGRWSQRVRLAQLFQAQQCHSLVIAG